MPDKKTRGISNLPVAIPDVPDAPTVSASNVGTSRAYNNGAATVTITPTTGGRPSSYSITTTPTTTTTVATGSTTITGLASATAYTVTATPSNVSATGPAGTSASITATTVPQAPTIGTFTDGGTGTSGTLSFTAGATGGSAITGYKYSTDSVNYLAASGTTSPLSLTGLTPATYTFSVKAVNANGDSAASGTTSGTVITPSSFESIATVTVGVGGASDVTFNSIPQTYKSLQIRYLVKPNSTIGGYSNIRITHTGATSYTYHYLRGDGSTVVASDIGTAAYSLVGDVNFSALTNVGSGVVDIHDYASTTKNKTIRALHGTDLNGSGRMNLSSGLIINTAAIGDLNFNLPGSFGQGSTFALYGIKG